MIASNLNEVFQAKYITYISERYEQLWKACTAGANIIPVISTEVVERLFDIDILHNLKLSGGIIRASFEPYCDIAEPYLTYEQLRFVAFRYQLNNRKTFVDIKVAHNLFLYNMYKTDKLVLLIEDMYNAVQLHNEFSKAIITYCKMNYPGWDYGKGYDVSIEVNNQNGICYKELMDYIHYQCVKPMVSMKITVGNMKKYATIGEYEYDAAFHETSYDIRIHHINIQ